MKQNCGVLAYDALIGALSNREHVISMNTLCNMAKDNDVELYAQKIPIELVDDINFPVIMYTENHFEKWDKIEYNDVVYGREYMYILSQELTDEKYKLSDDEARLIKGADFGQMITPPKSKSPWEAATSGSTGGWASFAGPSETKNPDDPAGWGWVGPALTTAMGAIPGVGPALSAGMGAIGAAGVGGFQGTDSGWGKGIMDTLGGATAGYGLGSLGSGIGSGLKTAGQGVGYYGPGTSATGPIGLGAGGQFAESVAPLNKFISGFSSGMSEALKPFAGVWDKVSGVGKSVLSGINKVSGGLGTKALENPMALLGGIGALGSQFLGTTPEVPQIGQIASKWLNADSVTKAGALAKNIMTDEYMGDFSVSKETQALMQVQESEIKKSYAQRRKDMDRMGIAQNEQFMNSGERLEMHNRMNEEETQEVSAMQSEWLYRDKQTYSQNKYNTVMKSLDIDEETKRDLLFAESWEVMQKYNIDTQTLMNFREIARDAGMYAMQSGMLSNAGAF